MPLPGAADLAKRAIERCLALGRFSESDTGITRTFLSPPMPDGTYFQRPSS